MSSSVPAPQNDGPLSGELQFERAEPLPAAGIGPQCVACKQAIGKTYYHAQGMVVCELCAQRIQSGQQAPPVVSLGRAALFGAGAALAGCILYALVSILTGWEIGIVAIVVGVMVGKAVRYGSEGRGGRPQQILAVVLTYFAITTSYIPVFIYQAAKDPTVLQQAKKDAPPVAEQQEPKMSAGKAIFMLLLIAAAAPFLSLASGVSALITLFIIFIGLKQAWRITARSEILIMGPYEAAPAQ